MSGGYLRGGIFARGLYPGELFPGGLSPRIVGAVGSISVLIKQTMGDWPANPLQCRSNYSATSNKMKLVHWLLMGGLLRSAPLSPLIAVPNVTAHPSTASVPISVLLYNGPLLCAH